MLGPLTHEEAEDRTLVTAVEVHLDVVEEARVPELAHVLPQGFGRKRLPDSLVQIGQKSAFETRRLPATSMPRSGRAAGFVGFAGRQPWHRPGRSVFVCGFRR